MYFRLVQTSSWLVLWEHTLTCEVRCVGGYERFKHWFNSVQLEQPWQTEVNACVNHRRVILWFIYASGFGFGPREAQVWFVGTCYDHWTKIKFWHLTIDHDCLKEFEVQKNDEVSEGQKWDEMLVILTDYDYADWMVWMIFWLSLLCQIQDWRHTF